MADHHQRSLHTPSGHEVILEPWSGDVQMMSSLFVKVDCGWEEAAEDGASASPCSGPSGVHFHSPQASIRHVPPTWAASPRWAAPGSGSWQLQTQAPRHRPKRTVPYPRTPPPLQAQVHSEAPTHLCHTQVVPARRIYRSLHKKHLIALQFLRLSLLSPTDTPLGSLICL